LVAHQARRLVATHQQQPSGLRVRETLTPGDGPIIDYRQRREALPEGARLQGLMLVD